MAKLTLSVDSRVVLHAKKFAKKRGIRKERGNAKAKRIVAAVLSVFKIAPVDGAVIQEALQLPFADFEDALTATAARSADCDYVVTRDLKGFRGSPVHPLLPEAVTPLL